VKVFKIKDDMIHLNQLLKPMGWCDTGANANELITEGKVKVNGEVELRKRNKLKRGMVITYKDMQVTLE
jgi:ribosome-associated protein